MKKCGVFPEQGEMQWTRTCIKGMVNSNPGEVGWSQR